MATLHLQFFSSLCTIINSIEGPRKHPTNWAPQLLRPALSVSINFFISIDLSVFFVISFELILWDKVDIIPRFWLNRIFNHNDL